MNTLKLWQFTNHTLYVYMYIFIYIYVCVCVCSWVAVFHLSMFDQIIKTDVVDIILLRYFQVSCQVFWF